MPRAIFASVIGALVSGSTILPASAQYLEVSCVASGYDVIIVNSEGVEIRAGSVLKWREPFTRAAGTVSVLEPLKPGGRRVLAGAMGSNFLVEDGPCEVVVVGAQEGG